MTIPCDQTEYWDRAASSKIFGHPVCWDRIEGTLTPDSRILDYGCGYGRVCGELWGKGYRIMVGADSSPAMIDLARKKFPSIDFRVVAPCTFPFEDSAFDLVLLFTVLTSSPGDREQRTIVEEARRVLRAGGMLYVSDMPLQTDKRNLDRYDRYVRKYGIYGVFEVEDGAVVRHHDMALIRELLGDFEEIGLWRIDVETMNRHRARAFQYVGRKG